MNSKIAYRIRIETERDWETLLWLSDHGYDGGIYKNGEILGDETAESDGLYCAPYVLGFPEHLAWDCDENVSDDPDAFLSCCGSSSLSSALSTFIQEIV